MVAVREEVLTLGIRFIEPFWLLLLVPVIGGLLVSFRFMSGMRRARKVWALVIRALLASCVVVALAGPQTSRPNVGVCTIFVLDWSDSVKSVERKRAEYFVREAMQSLSPTDVSGVVVFGRDAVLESSPGGRRDPGPIRSLVTSGGSDLAAAIRLASAAFPDGKAKRIVLVSDGNETQGDTRAAAEVLASENIRLDTVSLGTSPGADEVSLVDFEVPNESKLKEPFEIRATIDSSQAHTAILNLDRDGKSVQRVRVSLKKGKNVVVLSEKPESVGFHRYRATLDPIGPGDDGRNNVGLGFVSVRDQPTVLLLQKDLAKKDLALALSASGLRVDLRGPAAAPTRAEDLQSYDAVILNDYNADSMTESQMAKLASATRESGIGLAMIGGENSFLPGGWYGSKVADALPVDLNIRQRKSFPATSILILCDASGSMGMIEDGVEKIKLAARAAEETVKLMGPMDRVGVGASSDGIEMFAPMGDLKNKEDVITKVRKLDINGGGVYVGPTVIEAEKILMAETTKVRHFILVADGNDSTDWRDALERAAKMRSQKITTTVIAIGDGKDVSELKKLAAVGGGRFYLAKKAAQLPAIFTRDAAIMSRSAIEEGAFVPKVNLSEESLRGVDVGSMPPLLAYCLADARPLARVGMTSPKNDPILAVWNYGLGRSLAFMSDAQPKWAIRWLGWSGFGTFWPQAVRSIQRRATRSQYQVALKSEGGMGKVTVRAFDNSGRPLPSLNATIHVATPSGQVRDVVVQQEAPGVYSGQFQSDELGSYIVSVAEPDAGGGTRVQASGFSVPYPAEFRSYRANTPLLKSLNEITGGSELTQPSQAIAPLAQKGESITDIWAWFAFAAMLMLPLDVAVRRIAIPFGEIIRSAVGRLTRQRGIGTETPEHIDRLRAAKERVSSGKTTGPEVPVVRSAATQTSKTQHPKSEGSLAGNLLSAKKKKYDQD